MKLLHRNSRLVLTGALLLAVVGCATTSPQPGAATEQSSSAAHRSSSAAHPSDSDSPTRLATSFDEAVRRGDSAWQSGNTDLALYLYVQALSFKPRDVSTLGKIGSIHQARGNLDLARKAFELAATAAPNDARATSHLGLVLLAQGEVDAADNWLHKSVASDANDWRSYDALGLIAQRRGHYDDALSFLQQATTLAPAEAGPLLHRGSVQLAMGDYGKAETSLQQSLDRRQTIDAWRLLGEAQAHRGEYAKALTSLLQVLDVPAAYNEVGQVATANHDNRIALEYFQKATDSSPVYFPEAARNAAMARERLTAGDSDLKYRRGTSTSQER